MAALDTNDFILFANIAEAPAQRSACNWVFQMERRSRI